MSEEKDRKIEYRKIWAMLWPSMRAQARWLIPLIFVFGFALAVLTVVEPYLYGRIVDILIEQSDTSSTVSEIFRQITPFLLVWIGAVIISTFASAFQSYATWWMGNRTLGFFLVGLFKRVLRLSVRRFEDERSGEILQRFNQAWDAVFEIISKIFIDVLIAFFTLALAFVAGLYLDWRMMLVSLIPIPFIFLVGYVNFKIARKGQDRVNKGYEDISGYVGDAFANIATVQSFTKERKLSEEASKKYWRVNRIQNKVNYIWTIAEGSYGSIFTTGRLLIFVFGAWFVINGSLSVGTLIMFLGFAGYLFRSTSRIVSTLPHMLRDLSLLNRAQKLWSEESAIQDTPEARRLKTVKGKITFDHVNFSYEKGRKVLRDLSFVIPDGATWALVGESGA